MVDGSTTGIFERIEYPLASIQRTMAPSPVQTRHKAPVLDAERKVLKIFPETQGLVKIVTFFQLLREEVVLETYHTIAVLSGKFIYKSVISISLATESRSPLAPDTTINSHRRSENKTRGRSEIYTRKSKMAQKFAEGSADKPTNIDSSSEGLMSTGSPGVVKLTAHVVFMVDKESEQIVSERVAEWSREKG